MESLVGKFMALAPARMQPRMERENAGVRAGKAGMALGKFEESSIGTTDFNYHSTPAQRNRRVQTAQVQALQGPVGGERQLQAVRPHHHQDGEGGESTNRIALRAKRGLAREAQANYCKKGGFGKRGKDFRGRRRQQVTSWDVNKHLSDYSG